MNQIPDQKNTGPQIHTQINLKHSLSTFRTLFSGGILLRPDVALYYDVPTASCKSSMSCLGPIVDCTLNILYCRLIPYTALIQS